MALEDDTGTALEQPADDIRSALTAALVSREAEAVDAVPAKPVAKAPKAAAKDAADEAGESDDAAGEAAAKDVDPSKGKGKDAKSADEGEAEPDAAAEKAEKDKTEAAKADATLTGKWSAKDKETFKALPPEGQDLIRRRHKEMEGAFTKKTQEIAAFRKEYEPVDRIFDPYREQMKQSGYTPQTLIQAWANVEDRLMKGEGVAVVAGLIRGYKVDLGQVAQALGLRPQQRTQAQEQNGEAQPGADGAAQIQLPPQLMAELNALRQRIDSADQRFGTEDRRRAEEAQRARAGAEQRVMTEIETFKSAQDDKGNMLHPHFEELETEMALLARAAIEARLPVPPLTELYEKAVWANPSTRDAAFAARDRAQQEKAAAEARAKAAKAKKAGSSVTGAPGSGQAQPGRRTEQSLREQLEAAADDSLSRV